MQRTQRLTSEMSVLKAEARAKVASLTVGGCLAGWGFVGVPCMPGPGLALPRWHHPAPPPLCVSQAAAKPPEARPSAAAPSAAAPGQLSSHTHHAVCTLLHAQASRRIVPATDQQQLDRLQAELEAARKDLQKLRGEASAAAELRGELAARWV